MPNIPQQQTIVQYLANSSQSQYTFAFYAPLPTDIQVFYQASNATPIPSTDLLTLNTDYTVTYNSDPLTGGYITLLFTATTGYYLTINRQVAASLNTNFSDAQNFNGANLDMALDRLLLLCQQNLNYILQRNLSYVINTYLPNAQPYTQLPPLPQNYFWVGSGNGIIAAQVATIPSASVLQSMLANNAPDTDGARLVGYYDPLNSNPTTVDAYLQLIGDFMVNIIPYIENQLASQLFQPGDQKDFSGGIIQTGWLLCNGSAVSRATYPNLLSAITQIQSGTINNSTTTITGLTSTAAMYVGMAVEGNGISSGTTIATIVSGTSITVSNQPTSNITTPLTFFYWGNGDGATTFNVPDSRRKVNMGAGGTASTDPLGVGNVVGQTGGQESHTQTVQELASHTHPPLSPMTFFAGIAADNSFNYSSGSNNGKELTTGSTGNSSPFNVIQPVNIVTRIIKY